MLKDHRGMEMIGSGDDRISIKKLLHPASPLPVMLDECVPVDVFHLALRLILLVEFGKLSIVTVYVRIAAVSRIAMR